MANFNGMDKSGFLTEKSIRGNPPFCVVHSRAAKGLVDF